jgi:glycosyltransferase involved in cell wall biosynthesis
VTTEEIAPEAELLLSIVIPLFDEEQNLRPLLAEIEAALPSIPARVEVIAVDDGSRDGSWRLLQELASTRPWLRALRFLSNRGQTAAMSAGIAAARGDLVAFLDADLQNDPADLARLLEPILTGEADVVCGWRVQRKDNPWTRTLPSAIANYVMRRSLGFKVHDVGCTLKVFRRRYIEDVALFGEMHRFLPSYAKEQGARVTELPVSHRPRHAGTSKYGLERVGKVLIDLLTVKMLNQYGASPAYLFGKVALLFFTLGTAAFGLVAYRAFVLGRVESTPMIFIMTLLYIAALLSLMSGLLAELNMRVLHHVGGQRSYKIVESLGFTDERGGER